MNLEETFSITFIRTWNHRRYRLMRSSCRIRPSALETWGSRPAGCSATTSSPNLAIPKRSDRTLKVDGPPYKIEQCLLVALCCTYSGAGYVGGWGLNGQRADIANR